MHSISSERPLSIGGMQPPLVEDNKGSSQATQVAAGIAIVTSKNMGRGGVTATHARYQAAGGCIPTAGT